MADYGIPLMGMEEDDLSKKRKDALSYGAVGGIDWTVPSTPKNASGVDIFSTPASKGADPSGFAVQNTALGRAASNMMMPRGDTPNLDSTPMGATHARMDVTSHAPMPGKAFVPGIGVLGADYGGYVKGDLAAQKFALAANADAREEEQLGLAKNEFGMKKDYMHMAQQELGIKLSAQNMEEQKFNWAGGDVLKKKTMEANMQRAATDGGYEGVIDYLKVADPATAIQFHAQKLKLDDAILSNNVMKSVAQNEKSKAMLDSYGVLGKMYMALNNAKPEDRAPVYQAMKPLVQTVLGENAPKTIEEALPIGMLAVAQSVDANQLYKANKGVVQMSSALGKLNQDIGAYTKAGITDPEQDPGLKALLIQRDNYAAKAQQTFLQQASTQMSVAASKQQTAASKQSATEGLQKNLNTASKDYSSFMDQYTGIKGQLDVLQKDPTNGAAQGILGTMMASAVQKGVLTDRDFARTTASNATWKKLIDNHRAEWQTGKTVVLAPDEIKNLTDSFNTTSKYKLERQKIIEGQYQEKIGGYKQSIFPDMVKMPSEQYMTMEKNQQMQQVIQANKLDKMLPPELQESAANAIIRGASIESVMQRAQEMQNANKK